MQNRRVVKVADEDRMRNRESKFSEDRTTLGNQAQGVKDFPIPLRCVLEAFLGRFANFYLTAPFRLQNL